MAEVFASSEYYDWNNKLPTLIGSSIVKGLPLTNVTLQAFGGLNVNRLRSKIINNKVKVKSPVVALLVGGNDVADGLEPQNVSTSYQLLLQDIYQKNPQVHVVICAIPPRPYDVELSTIQETNRQLSIIPKSTSNCSFTPSTHTTFIRKGQPIIDDFDPEDCVTPKIVDLHTLIIHVLHILHMPLTQGYQHSHTATFSTLLSVPGTGKLHARSALLSQHIKLSTGGKR